MSYNSFKPGVTWYDTDGNRIQAHAGYMFYENDTFYWYGENKEKSQSEWDLWHWGIRLYSSKDLYNWEFVKHVIDAGDCDPDVTAFQYPSFEIHGNSFKILSRTAWGGAKNFHDANHITYHEGTLE